MGKTHTQKHKQTAAIAKDKELKVMPRPNKRKKQLAAVQDGIGKEAQDIGDRDMAAFVCSMKKS
jgi:hypothetical protein